MHTNEQIRILRDQASPFEQKLAESSNFPLTAINIKTLQVNIGRKCNQACVHCHVNSSPFDDREMTRQTVDLCLDVINKTEQIETVDITGGAPEMNKSFRYFVSEARKEGKQVIDRCNLTILEEPGYEYLYDFLAQNQVQIIASLPHFRARTTNLQRGAGVFEKSITALQKLNNLGYGSKLVLNLIYNPSGLFISSDQTQLEREFKDNLLNNFGITFNNLYCLINFPIGRFLEILVSKNRLQDYMDCLVNAFNPCTLDYLMCRNQISVGYDGNVYDCDFNQMLDMKATAIGHIRDFDIDTALGRKIMVANHCYCCTAGRGSSCGGELPH